MDLIEKEEHTWTHELFVELALKIKDFKYEHINCLLKEGIVSKWDWDNPIDDDTDIELHKKMEILSFKHLVENNLDYLDRLCPRDWAGYDSELTFYYEIYKERNRGGTNYQIFVVNYKEDLCRFWVDNIEAFVDTAATASALLDFVISKGSTIPSAIMITSIILKRGMNYYCEGIRPRDPLKERLDLKMRPITSSHPDYREK